MKVITEKGGLKAKAVNDKAVISHGIAQKTELSKKSGGGLEKQQVRTVGGTEKATKPDVPNGAPFVVQKRADFAKAKSAQTESLKAALTPNAEKQLTSAKSKVLEPKHKIASSRPPKQFKLSENRPKNKSYKVLNNGTLADKGITKRKERVIYRKQNSALKKIKPRAIDKSKLKSLKGLKNGQRIIPKPRKLTSAAKSTANIAAKPANTLKNEFMSQAAKSDNSGVKAINLGLQTADYSGRTIKTAVNKGIKTAKNGAKITKRIHRTLRTSTPELRRKLKKQVNHNLAKTTKKSAAQTRKAAKAASRATKAIIKTTFKAAKFAVKAVVKTVSKVVGFIVRTMPWSLIIICAVLIVLIVVLMIGSLFSSAGGSVAGGAAWLVDDNSSQTPEEIYEGYKEYIKQAEKVLRVQKDSIENTVTEFCESDTKDPRKIIQYIDEDNNVTYYPAYGADDTINDKYIEAFEIDDYADYLSVLFVLMTREKQQADGVSDEEIYDFDFEKEDFEEFIKTLNVNNCRWGSTFVVKTSVITYSEYCPGQNCKRKTISGCKCCKNTIVIDGKSYTYYYCGGHPYCPGNHTKLTVKLYTADDFYEKSFAEIYNFSDNEKARYEASRAIIKGLLEYWEE